MSRTSYDIGHVVADCMVCYARFEGRYARQSARRHSERTGHRVIGEQSRTFSYGERSQ